MTKNTEVGYLAPRSLKSASTRSPCALAAKRPVGAGLDHRHVLFVQAEFLDGQFHTQLGNAAEARYRDPLSLEVRRHTDVFMNHDAIGNQIIGAGDDDRIGAFELCIDRR